MKENPYKRLLPLERRPDGTPYRMTPAQRKQANALIRRECCNCEDGNCIVLDDGDTCTCPQMVSFSVCCKWFRWALLPHAGTLEAEIYRGRDLKRCQPLSNEAKLLYAFILRRAELSGKTGGRTSTGVFTCTIPSVRWWTCSIVGGRKP